MPAQIAGASGEGLISAVALAILTGVLAPVLMLHLITEPGPSFASFMNYLIPLWAVAVGILLLGEEPRWTALAALALTLGGLALSETAAAAGTGRVAQTRC